MLNRLSVLVLALPLLILTPQHGHACLWDYDTLQDELEQLSEAGLDQQVVIDTIIGKIPRYPDLYYEMRLERVTVELSEHPEKLELYDDAGVAADRIGDTATAFTMMERKRAQLEALTFDPDAEYLQNHWYRYHANIGTFYVHRWIKNGRDDRELEDVQTAHTHIKKALEYNQEAHFGREEIQLIYIEWILDSVLGLYQVPVYNHRRISEQGKFRWRIENLEKRDVTHEEAIKGIIGLMRLGAAWESRDALGTLKYLLKKKQMAVVQLLIDIRLYELRSAGEYSEDKRDGLILAKENASREISYFESERSHYSEGTFTTEAEELVEYGKIWRKYREEFMLRKLKRGEHPDTHRHFWWGYDPPELGEEAPAYTITTRLKEMHPYTLVGILLGFIALVFVMLGFSARLIPKKAAV